MGLVPCACGNYHLAGGATRRKQRCERRDRPAQLRDVIAQRVAEAARFHEVALHVDDQHRGPVGLQIELIWLGGNGCHDMRPPGKTVARGREAPAPLAFFSNPKLMTVPNTTWLRLVAALRSEERRGGEEGVSKG